MQIFDKLYTTTFNTVATDISKLTKNVFIIHNNLKQKNRQLIKGLDFFHSYILDTSYGEHIPNQRMIDKFNQQFNNLDWDIKL